MSGRPSDSSANSLPFRYLRSITGAACEPLKSLAQQEYVARGYRRGADLGADSSGLRFLSSGWACLTRYAGMGRSQILTILVPGDPVDCGRRGQSDCQAIALTSASLIDLGPADDPRLAAIVQASEYAAVGRFLDQLVRLSASSAYQALSSLLLDLYDRLDRVGLMTSEGAPMPLAQSAFAHALGLTTTHVNRTLQELRGDGLLELSQERLRVLDRPALTSAAGR